MNRRVKEFDVTLEEPIELHKGGDVTEALTVLIKSPSAKHRNHAHALKQMFTRAMMKQQDSLSDEQKKAAEKRAEKTKDEDISAQEIVMMMLASDEDFNLFNDTFRKLVTSGCAELEGENFTTFHYDQLSLDDSEKLLGEYMKHFLVASLLQM